MRHGYWGKDGEEIKYQVFADDDSREKLMSDEIKKDVPEDLKEYAGGWMTERKGTDAPAFLKLAFPVIGLELRRLPRPVHERRRQSRPSADRWSSR